MTYKEFRKLVSKKKLSELVNVIEEKIRDPRSTKKGCGVCIHSISMIIFIIIIAKVCGVKTYRGIELFAKVHIVFLEKYFKIQINKLRELFKGGKIKNILPSDDTFRRVIEKIIPDELFSIYEWLVDTITDSIAKRSHIAIDGKCLKGTKTEEVSARDIVTAFNCESSFTISQEEVPDKKNEIAAILNLLEKIEERCYKNLVITIDAIAANPQITKAIFSRGWDYCIAFKENQPICYKQAYLLLLHNLTNYFAKEICNKHGIQIERRFYLFSNINNFPRVNEFLGLRSIGAVISFGVRNGVEFAEVRFFFTSLTSKEEFKIVVRDHWKIENLLHRSLDVFYDEDKSHIKNKNAPLNFNIIRKIGLIFLILGKFYARDKNMTSNILINFFMMKPNALELLLNDELVEELA